MGRMGRVLLRSERGHLTVARRFEEGEEEATVIKQRLPLVLG